MAANVIKISERNNTSKRARLLLSMTMTAAAAPPTAAVPRIQPQVLYSFYSKKMENPKQSTVTITDGIDVNNPEFYMNVQNETESDKAKLKKTLEIVCNLRLEAAELEVETASLYHADLWHAIEELKAVTEQKN
ncbi:hypothetical protein O0L34_g895 [Tuta absoluta]|nr:hypothetical protein O0L34_g895 [Tuta absoluta]